MFTTFRASPKRPRQISPIKDAIPDIRAGKMVILMDDENRENEGDLCMAASKVTPAAINFMAKYGRGLICFALAEERIDQLGLSMMVSHNRAPLGTAFTVSIDARHGVTTGVSAHDRAMTIRRAMQPGSGPEDFVTPGHVFPLRAVRGGVLVRTGQTEGGVDLARLAGLPPASVICEIMNEDGSMARLPDLERFAARHALKICTIADLIEYRLRHDSLVHRVAEAVVPTRVGGPFKAYVYKTDVSDGEHLVLVRGDIRADKPILVRAHAEYLPGDVFGSIERDTSALLRRSMEMIAKAGRGVILYLRREAQGEELLDRTRPRETARRPSTEPRNRATDFREYGVGAQILRDVGLGKIRLITNYPRRMVSLPGYGLEIVECVPIRLSPPRAKPLHAKPLRVASNAAVRRVQSKSAARRSTSKA
jgi:3,4-dihydroxy 2-butanone 4-phosphate synthase / GTP cyclohydrolase II